jgi:hypothetical protein
MHTVKAYRTSLEKEHPFPTDRVAEWAQSQYGHCGGEKIISCPTGNQDHHELKVV